MTKIPDPKARDFRQKTEREKENVGWADRLNPQKPLPTPSGVILPGVVNNKAQVLHGFDAGVSIDILGIRV